MTTIKFNPFPELSTERLYLRQLKMEDDKEVFLLRSDAVVNKHLDRPKAQSIEDAQSFIQKINKGIENDQWVYWSICLKESKQLIGTICLWNFSAEENKAELGYELLPAFHGKGIMQEAIEIVVGFCFQTLHLQKIEAWTTSANIPSIKLLEKNEFMRDHAAEKSMDKTKLAAQIIFSLSKN